jgi:hypothetical protein
VAVSQWLDDNIVAAGAACTAEVNIMFWKYVHNIPVVFAAGLLYKNLYVIFHAFNINIMKDCLFQASFPCYNFIK